MESKKLNIILSICIVISIIISAGLVLSAEPTTLFEVNAAAGGVPVKFITHENISDMYLEESGDGYAYYVSNSTHINVYVAKENTILAEKIAVTKNYQTSNPTDVNGTVVYLSESNFGNASGQTRFDAFNYNRSNELLLAVATPSANETSYIMHHLEAHL